MTTFPMKATMLFTACTRVRDQRAFAARERVLGEEHR